MVEHHVDMFVKLFADQEVMVKFLQQLMLLVSKDAGISRVDGREMTTEQWVDFTLKHDRAMIIIDEVEQLAVLHLPFRMLLIELCFQFELHHSDCLMHLSRKSYRLLIEVFSLTRENGAELRTGIIGVSIHGKSSQWYHINSISFLKCSEIGVAQ